MPEGARPRFRFSDNRLLVFGPAEILCVEGWPNPSAARKTAASWEPFEPRFLLVRPYRRRNTGASRQSKGQQMLGFAAPRARPASDRRRAFDAFRFSLPRPVARGLEGFRSRQWPLLVLCSRSAGFVDLLASTPPLAYLLSLHWSFHLPPGRAIDNAVSLRQRDLAGALGLPATNSTVQLLRKIHCPALDRSRAAALRRALRNPESCRFLPHVERLHAGVLAFLASPPLLRLASPSLMLEIGARREELYRAPTAAALETALELSQQDPSELPAGRFRSCRQVEEFVEDSRRAFRAREQAQHQGAAFPPPPLPGSVHIQALRTPAELVEEGRRQDNCVAGYAPRVRRGDTYIYRVTWPERCTLSIALDDDTGEWRRDELEIAGNCPASPETITLVDRWLRRHRLGA